MYYERNMGFGVSTSLSLTFLICKMGLAVPTLQGATEAWTRYLEEPCDAHLCMSGGHC